MGGLNGGQGRRTTFPAPSPLQDITALQAIRNPKIPRDQQKIFDERNCWAVDLPDGILNVPDHVIEGVEAAYRASIQASEHDGGSSTASRSSNGKEDAHPKSSPAPRSSPPRTDRSPSSSPERAVSWSPSSSPQPEQRNRSPVVGSSMVCETPAVRTMAPPPCPAPRAAAEFSFLSSDNEEDDLETELPQAQPLPAAPVNRVTARLPLASTDRTALVSSFNTDNTPPCAQPELPVIDSSWTPPPPIPLTAQPSTVPSPRPVVELPRPRRMKPIDFGDDMPAAKRAQGPASFTSRMPFTTISVMESIESSHPDSSDSVVPQSLPQGTGAWTNSNGKRQLQPNGDLNDENYDGRNESLEVADDQVAEPLTVRANQSKCAFCEQATTANAVVSISSNQDPFHVFTEAYPEYTTKYAGNLLNFVLACVTLQYLQQERILVEYCYDDFIRVYSGDYQPYLRGKDPEELTAIEFFCTTQTDLVFQRKVVKKDNLERILACYPAEVSKAKKYVKGDIQADAKQTTTNTLDSAPISAKAPLDAIIDRPTRRTPVTDGGKQVDVATPEGRGQQHMEVETDNAMDIDDPEAPDSPVHILAANGVSQSQFLITQPPAPASPELATTPRRQLQASLSPPHQLHVPSSPARQPHVPSSARRSSPSSPQLGTQRNVVESTAPAATSTPSASARGRLSSSYYFNRKVSSRQSSAVRTPDEEEARRKRLRRYLEQRRASGRAASGSSKGTPG